MAQSTLLGVAFAVGAVMALYLPMIGTMGQHLGSPVLACIPFFVVGLTTALVLGLATGRLSGLGRVVDMPPWLLLSGVGACVMILGTAALIPRIGASLFFVMLVAGQLAVGAVVAHYGLLHSAVVPLTFSKAAGLALVAFGAFLAIR